MTGIFFDWPVGWHILIVLLLIIWIVISIFRKDRKFKPQLIMGVIAVCFAFVVENIGITFGLWSYATGNWPLILWIAYFLTGIAFYQFVMLVVSRKNRKW